MKLHWLSLSISRFFLSIFWDVIVELYPSSVPSDLVLLEPVALSHLQEVFPSQPEQDVFRLLHIPPFRGPQGLEILIDSRNQ